MQPCVALQGRETGSGSCICGAWAAWFLLSFSQKLSVPGLDAWKWWNNSSDCSRRTDNMTAQSGSRGNVQCSCLSVWGGKSHSGAATCYQPAEWFLPLPGLWRTSTETHTHTHRVMNRGCKGSRVWLSEHFVFHWMNSYMCVLVRLWACVWQENSRGWWAVTGDILTEPGHINQKNRCLHAVPPV